MLLYSFLGIIWVIPNFHPISANPGYGPPDHLTHRENRGTKVFAGLGSVTAQSPAVLELKPLNPYCQSHMLHGAGIFTYKTGWFLG